MVTVPGVHPQDHLKFHDLLGLTEIRLTIYSQLLRLITAKKIIQIKISNGKKHTVKSKSNQEQTYKGRETVFISLSHGV